MNSELLLKVFHIFYIGGKAGDGVTLPCLRVWFSFFCLFCFLISSLVISRDPEPVILLSCYSLSGTLKKKKRKKKKGCIGLDLISISPFCFLVQNLRFLAPIILKLNQLKHYHLFFNVNTANTLQKNKWPYKTHSSVICKICYESECFLNMLLTR